MKNEKFKMKNWALGAVLALAVVLLVSGSVYAYRGKDGQSECDPERHEAMEQVFENNDYQAWKELMEGKGRVLEVVNEDNFARFAEAHQLKEEGKLEEAKKIREELGLSVGERMRAKEAFGRGYRKGLNEGRQSDE